MSERTIVNMKKNSINVSIYLVLTWAIGGFLPDARGHDGPNPVAHWVAGPQAIQEGRWKARLGPDAVIQGAPQLVSDPLGVSLKLDGRLDGLVVADSIDQAAQAGLLPTRSLTLAVWVAINTPLEDGGIISALQDNGGFEKGFVLGYDDQVFTFGLSTTGANRNDPDGDGVMTYLKGKTRYELGRLYHVVATFDGAEARLYVNGQLDAATTDQHGDILHIDHGWFVLGGYKDDNEDSRMHGRLREVALYDRCAPEQWVRRQFEHNADLAKLDAIDLVEEEAELRWVVAPYLQFVTPTGIVVMWETSRASSTLVRYGETANFDREAKLDGNRLLHEVKLEGLKPETGYFYQVVTTDAEGQTLKSEVLSFQTAVRETTAYAFAVISDTQANPEVVKTIAQAAWGQRPNFLLIPGDLVTTGTIKSHWTDHFFPNMRPLIERVAFFPVLGNHECDAKFYYDYMSLPKPEYYYEFTYGNSHFFVIDSNKNVLPGSEQYRWLESALADSKATWKFVAFHHPVYSSDEDDYGNMWKGKSLHGDLRVRALTSLFDKYGVDLVWNGHIHSYERTWPIFQGKTVERGGTTYMIVGGGGGNLENPGPIKTWFQNNVRRGHHYVMVAINGRSLELRAFDLENRLFDTFTLVKPDVPPTPGLADEAARDQNQGGR